ncbi:chromatin target of PRMT1b isoform X2 [Hoplias malabaricus]|uniref:chromatin target of PRMT1b isoform X2 n=1 Tax=Hoplias malabaricus TaxID=27720 RepID=UPI003462977E
MSCLVLKMNPPPTKLYLKSTSSMSLHDRFSSMLKNDQSELNDLGGNGQQIQFASVKNRRLAQQMANRPSVLAALQNVSTLKYRLGKRSIKARLTHPWMRGGLRGMSGHWGRPRGRGAGALLRGTLSLTCMRGLPGVVSDLETHQQHKSISRPRVMLSKGVRGPLRGKGLNSGGCGLFVGHGWGYGRIREDSRPVPTREELDEQLDDYMSMTKSHLDAQLDAYMAEVDSEDLQ